MTSTISMELFSGAKSRKSYQIVAELIDSFKRHQRILVPSPKEFEKTGLILADLGWPASKKSNDVLIGVFSRRIGAEIWTCDYSDFAPVAKKLDLVAKKI